MKKLTLFLFLFFPILVFSQDKKFSYTFLDVIATNANGIGYIGDISLGLPASLYVKASLRDEEVKSDNTVYQKSKKIAALGYHSSIADIFKSVSKSGYSFNFARIMDVYVELGVNQWELENPTKQMKTGSDLYAQAGLKMGDTQGWEFNFFLESTKLAEVDLDPITKKLEYSLDGKINNNIGFKFINHSMKNMGYSVGLSHDDFSGLSTAVGVRFGL
jgi:hypothetical protein